MRTNQLCSLAAVSVLWLCVGAGCQKDPPQPQSCNNGTCCMQDVRQYDYVETIENQPADLIRRTLLFKNGFPSNAQREEFKAFAIGICDLSLSKINGLTNTVPPNAQNLSDYPYQYRVWGKVYHDRNTQTLLASPILFVFIDRIEEVN